MKKEAVEVVVVQDDVDLKQDEWPESSASLYSQLTYDYVTPILKQGACAPLQAEDLPVVSVRESAAFLREEYQRCDRGVKSALVGAGASSLKYAAGWQFLVSTCLIAEPLLLREVVLAATVHNWRASLIRGVLVAVAVGANSTVKAFAQQRQLHLSTRAGQRVRALALAEIYAAVLRRSTRATSSSVATLAGVDATKLFEVSLDAHLVWAAPAMVIVISLLLVLVVGDPVAAFSGVACLVAVLPLAKLLTQKLISLRRAKAPHTDSRVEEVGEVISGIRITKLAGWEPLWAERWKEKRNKELRYTRREMIFSGISLLLVVMSPVIATVCLFVVAMNTDRNARITPAKAFTVVSLIGSVRFPLNKLGTLVGQVAQAWRALDRIATFVEHDNHIPPRRDHSTAPESTHDGIELSVRRGAFLRRGPTGEASFVAGSSKRLDLDVRRGDLVMCFGQVASGKTSFLLGLLQELEVLDHETKVNMRYGARLAVATQEPCVLNATLRDNVTFGAAMRRERYNQAITACQLDRDIDALPAADLTEIGERGVTLSGGQRARISLARVVYSDASIALLDDVLSALDAKTQRAVFEALFDEQNGVLRDTAVVFVTHAAHFAPRATAIIVLDQSGDVAFKGTWNDLVRRFDTCNKDEDIYQLLRPLVEAARHQNDHDDLDALEMNLNTVGPNSNTEIVRRRARANDAQLRKATTATLIKNEQREEGMASLSTWLKWTNAAGGKNFLFIQCLLLALDRLFYVATEWWLARWADAREKDTNVFGQRLPSQREGLSSARQWTRVYLILTAISTVFCFLRTQWGFFAGVTAGKNLYERASMNVLNAPIGWFDETPLGRIISRFSYDTEQVDIQLTQKASMFLISVGWAITGTVVQLALSKGVMAIILIPIIVQFYRLQLFYRKSSVDLQRLDAVSRTPLQQLLAEAVESSITIRCYGVQNAFDLKFLNAVDKNSQSLLAWTTSQRWIGLRLDLCAAIVATFAALLIATLRRRLDLTAAFSGLLMIWSLQVTTTFMFLVTTSVEAEMAVTSVERMTEDIPNEFQTNATLSKVSLPSSWPSQGQIEFQNVSLRYRMGLPCALKNLHLSIPAGKRCAVVGRTGSGKTSTIAALFRLFPVESGSIVVDNIPILDTDLQQCRRKMAKLIPQDAVLFTGQVRRNIDPFDNYSDDEVARAIHLVFPTAGQSGETIDMTTHVEEGGKNFSTGERQLLALARALVAKPKILCLDEATSSLDQATDQNIQQLLRTLPELQYTTVLCVAHRLFTVIDYDFIAVLEKGQCVEFGSPHKLATSAGFFSDLIDATGPETAATLRRAALGGQDNSEDTT